MCERLKMGKTLMIYCLEHLQMYRKWRTEIPYLITNHWLTSCAFHISHSMNNGIYSVYVIPLSLLNVHIHTTYRHTYLRISLCSVNYENKCKISLQRKKALSLPPIPLLCPFRRHSSRLGLLSKIHVKFHVNQQGFSNMASNWLVVALPANGMPGSKFFVNWHGF